MNNFCSPKEFSSTDLSLVFHRCTFDIDSRCAKMFLLCRGKVFLPAIPASRILRETHFAGLEPSARGKVRDIYDLGDQLLIVATDRLSAFDVILPTSTPDKGRV